MGNDYLKIPGAQYSEHIILQSLTILSIILQNDAMKYIEIGVQLPVLMRLYINNENREFRN